METKLKTSIAGHVFEAEGEQTFVEARFEDWRALVERSLAQPGPPADVRTPKPPTGTNLFDLIPPPPPNGDPDYSRVMKHDDRIVSLTVRPENIDEAVLMLMLGQKAFRANDAVSGFELMEGLTVSGQTIERVDRVMDRLAGGGFVIVIGKNRARRYRLTNTGAARAKESAVAAIATVA